MTDEARAPRLADLRMPMLGVIAWAAALATHLAGVVVLVALGAGAVLAFVLARSRPAPWASVGTWLLLASAVAGGAVLRTDSVVGSPVAALARQHATVSGTLVITSDPRLTRGRFGERTVVRARVVEIVGRGKTHSVRAPVVVFGPPKGDGWQRLHYGARVRFEGRLSVADTDDVAGLLGVRGNPRVTAGPSWPLRAAEQVRAGVRRAVERDSTVARGLVPGLVDGDDAGLPAEVLDDFRTTGLTHLVAVSGTNLTIVAGFFIFVARWCRVRGRGLALVGLLSVVGFVLLARSEPSVLRAAAMGTVGLLAFGNGGPRRAPRALGACIVALMLLDPWLAAAPGFVLSVLATAGIVFIAPGWSRAMRRWLPTRLGWLAEAVAVPTAAQLACTPVVAAISGQVSVTAVLANMAAGPVVAAATVLGLVGGLVALISPVCGQLVALPAAWSAEWVVAVARHAAALPTAAYTIATTPVALVLLTSATVVAIPVLGWVAARRTAALVAAVCMVLLVLVRMPTFGWPPRDWVLVMCDVGQGDGLVLRASPSDAIVVDTGPDPRPMDRCLRELHVKRIPLVVLTHFHADHIGGLAGVLPGRSVGGIEVSPYADPAAGADDVRRIAARAHVPVTTAAYGTTAQTGALTWQVLAPSGPAPSDSGSPPNDDSVVMLVRTHGITMLLMGDEEPGSQERIEALFPGLRADVLKVAHHGSAKQDAALIEGLGARIAIISVGKDNDYGHPAPSLLGLLHRAGPVVHRTDRDGSIAIVVDGGLRVVTRR